MNRDNEQDYYNGVKDNFTDSMINATNLIMLANAEYEKYFEDPKNDIELKYRLKHIRESMFMELKHALENEVFKPHQ